MKTKKTDKKKTAKKAPFKKQAPERRQVLLLVPSLPSPQASREKNTVRATLALASAGHEVLCLPENKPLSANRDEALWSSRGVNVYAFPSVTRNEVFDRVKSLITAARPDFELIGFVGLGTLRRHLTDTRMFAPGKSFFAVLDRADVAALRGKAGAGPADKPPSHDGDSKLLSCCNTVFCEYGPDADFLRRFFYVDARPLGTISAGLAELDPERENKPIKIGVISPSPLHGALDLRGQFTTVRKAVVGKTSPDFAAMNRLILGSSPEIPAWAVISRPFSSCEALWFRLKTVFQAFPNAGMVLPSPVVCGLPVSAIVLEAASLNLQGRHSEPLLIDDRPLVVIRPDAFKMVGGFDTRFSMPGCAWTDLGLRMRQAGLRVITAEDAVVSNRPQAAVPGDPDLDLLVRKWCADGLRVMELLVSELGGKQP